MILQISGLDDLPSTFRADFANTETGQSKSVIGTDGEVHVPYEYFVPGATIHCWLVWTGADYAVTKRHIMIPIARRATPTDEEPTPDEQGVIDQAIAALNDAVAQTGQDVETAAGYAEQAERSAQTATDAKDNAMAAQNAARAYRDQTMQSASDAADSAQSAFQSKTDAQAAAASVADAMDTLEATIHADLQAAKESGEFDGADGVSPTVTVTPITDGHQVMITDAEGEHTFDVTDGEDGFSPIATVTQTQTGAVISVTDKTGTTTATVTNGAKGDPGTPGTDGFSPVATVTQTQTGATISITDKAGTTTAQISNGAKGDPGDDYVLTAQDKAEIAQQAAAEVDVPVQDVQVDGTSILNAQGVANVPIADTTNPGVIIVGNGLQVSLSTKKIMTQPTSINEIKNGTNLFNPIAPYHQHESTFYGLTKAAGVNMASSSNPVGTYTDEAKIAIQKMLGIYEAPWELIREDTVTNETEADIEITVDGNGQAFELTDVIVLFETPRQETASAKGSYGQIHFYPYAASPTTRWPTESGAWTQNANTSAHGIMAKLEQSSGVIFIEATTQTTSSNSANVIRRYNAGFTSYNGIQKTSNSVCIWKIGIPAVTGTGHYILYGKRKWN